MQGHGVKLLSRLVVIGAMLIHNRLSSLHDIQLQQKSETVFYRFDLQDINDGPKKTQYHVVDLLVSGQPAQSESQ